MALIRVNRTRPSLPVSNRDLGLLDDAFSRFFDDEHGVTPRWTPPVDIAESEDELILTAEVPGFSKKDINLMIEDGVLTLSGERVLERKNDEYHRIERSHGKFVRSFTLPESADVEKVSAAYKDGVLVITLPKREEAKPKQIAVKVQ